MSEKVQITIKNKVGEKYADLQTKIVTPSKETQVIRADDGYYGLQEVIVNPPEIDGEVLNENINSVKTMITDGTATAEDIREGKTAYVKGEKITGSMNLALEMINNADNCQYLFYNRGELAKQLEKLTDIEVLQIGNDNIQSSCEYMFENCNGITHFPFALEIIQADSGYGSGKTQMFNAIFKNCSLEHVSLILQSSSFGTSFQNTFYNCKKLKEVNIQINNENSYGTRLLNGTFNNCENLETIKWNIFFSGSNNYFNSVFYNCKALQNVKFKRLSFSIGYYIIGAGDGTYSGDYATKLTVESLLSLCQAKTAVTDNVTIQIGSANTKKLQEVYVKLAVNSSSATDYNGYNVSQNDYDKIKPFEVCQPTDEGAMTISEYMALKNTTLI